LIELRLDVTPVPKGRPRMNRKTGAVYTPVATAQFEKEVAWQAKVAMKGREPASGPLSVVVGCWCPMPKSFTKAQRQAALAGEIWPKGDTDNFAKSVLDSLNGIVWNDDEQITQLTATKRYSSAPALTVTVRKA
jgi:Holliday junction resolvase RusA-like endonuclease